MTNRPCLGCGKLTPRSRCTDCTRTRERQRQRPTTSERGYGQTHQALRLALQPTVDAGQATCWRCEERILPGTPWDVGHDDKDRTRYRGPEHADCNRSAAASRGNRQR